MKDALLSLLAEEPLSDISISQICARAQLTRPTFYNHYRTKDALAAEVIDNALGEFATHVESANVESTQGMLRAYLGYWSSRWPLLQLIAENGLLPLVGERFKPHLERIYANAAFTDKTLGSNELAYHNAFLSAGMASLLGHWAQNGTPTDSEELATYMEHMLDALHAGMEDERS